MPQREMLSISKIKDSRSTGARELNQEALQLRDSLVDQYYSFVEIVVSRLINAMRLPVSLREDFISAGSVGLIEAAGRYQPERGLDFKAYAFLRIRGAVIDYIRSACELNGYAYRKFRALEIAQQLREDQLAGRAATGASKSGGEGVDYLEKISVAFRLLAETAEEEAQSTRQDNHNPELALLRKQQSKKIKALIATLPEKERIIIEQHYFYDRKLVDVAELFSGLSKSWVSRLHERALGLLREKMLESMEDVAA